MPIDQPLLAVGADLKNAVTLVVNGQAFVSQHIGDLDHYQAYRAFQETIHDLVAMYDVSWDDLLVVHDAHPQYLSTTYAKGLPATQKFAVQHHRAHVASVLAERGEWDKQVLGVSFDGTGYGDDGSIWGGEFFVGSVRDGFERVAHLRRASSPEAMLLLSILFKQRRDSCRRSRACPTSPRRRLASPSRYQSALELVRKDVRSFTTTSVGGSSTRPRPY